MAVEPAFSSDDVRAAFEAFSEPERTRLLRMRRLIFDTAAETPGVGRLEETLKWGQPAYLTPETKSGSTIRLGMPKQGGAAVYAHCRTSIVPEFRSMFADGFEFEGNRAVLLRGDPKLMDRLRLLVRRALTYRLKS